MRPLLGTATAHETQLDSPRHPLRPLGETSPHPRIEGIVTSTAPQQVSRLGRPRARSFTGYSGWVFPLVGIGLVIAFFSEASGGNPLAFLALFVFLLPAFLLMLWSVALSLVGGLLVGISLDLAWTVFRRARRRLIRIGPMLVLTAAATFGFWTYAPMPWMVAPPAPAPWVSLIGAVGTFAALTVRVVSSSSTARIALAESLREPIKWSL